VKISTQLIASVLLITLIATPFLGLSVFYSARSLLQDSIVQRQLITAQEIMNTVDRILYGAYQDIRVLAEDRRIEKFLESPERDPTLKQNKAAIVEELALHEKLLLTGPWDAIFLLDKHGTMVASTVPPSMEEKFRSSVSTRDEMVHPNKTYYSDLVISKETGKPTIVFAAPIHSEKAASQTITGTVIAYFSWAVILQLLYKVEEGAYIRLFNQQGVVIAAPPVSREEILQVNLADLDLVKRALAGQRLGSGVFQSSVGPQDTVLGTYTLEKGFLSYRGNGWGLLIESPIDIVSAPVTQMAKEFTIRFLLMIVILAGAFYAIGKRLSRPIEMLTRTVQAIATGDLKQSVDLRSSTKSKNEVGILANAFQQMLENLNITTVSKSYVDNILASMIDTLIVVNPDATIRTVNQATLTLLGYEETELIGKNIGILIAEEESLHLFQKKGIEELIKKGSVRNQELTYVTKDKRKIPMLFSGSVMRNAQDQLEGIVCIAQDIRERKEFQELQRLTQVSLFFLRSATQARQEGRAFPRQEQSRAPSDRGSRAPLSLRDSRGGFGGLARCIARDTTRRRVATSLRVYADIRRLCCSST